mgnify:CR=1 FL=1
MPEGVQFNEWRPPRYESPKSKMIERVITLSGGLIQNERQASYVLLGFVVISIMVSLFLFFGGGPELPSEEQILRDTPATPIRR